jgi:hypothetical protein
MLSPLSVRLDPPGVRAGWLKMMLRVFRRHDRAGLYREMIALTERLIADAERERATTAPAESRARGPGAAGDGRGDGGRDGNGTAR